MESFGKAVTDCAHCSGLIIDLRGNPGGIGGMAMGMAGYLVDKPGLRLGSMYMRDATLNFVHQPAPGRLHGAAGHSGGLGFGLDVGDLRGWIEGSGPGASLRHAHRRGGAALGDRAAAERRRLPVRRRELHLGRRETAGRHRRPTRCGSQAVAGSAAGRSRPVLDAALEWIRKQRNHMNRTRSTSCAGRIRALAVPAFAADEPLPAAAAILDRYVEVTGGKAAYEKQKTDIETGKVEFAALGLKGTLISYCGRTRQIVLRIESGRGGESGAWASTAAWHGRTTPFPGRTSRPARSRVQALRDARINSTYHWRELYSKAETTGAEIVEGEDCYKVLLTPAEGNPETMYFGKKSGLLKKTTLIATSQQGDIPAELIASEYREFGGILMPAKVTRKAAGQEFTITIDDVKVNQEIPAGAVRAAGRDQGAAGRRFKIAAAQNSE